MFILSNIVNPLHNTIVILIAVKTYCIWLIGVILWNFGFSSATPIADVIAAIFLSIITYGLNKTLR
ncbi:MAG: hypothetical protein CMG75_04015 [Candidatus Marinimicrobia bacterium]|nr:hypothetical protein [Candidatus Neomarinimicrobiota bacterium]